MDSSNSTGLLMNIVRSLSTNEESKNKRNDEKVKLEKDFKECDRRLDNMISDHLTDLTSTIQAFSQLSSRITSSQEKVKAVKENLMSCKNLLHCKRDELKKLWVEGIKFKTVTALIEDVEKVKNVNEKLKRLLDSRNYMEATSLIMSSLALLEGDLNSVKGLDEVRRSLYMRREEVVGHILKELHNIIYIRSTMTITRSFQRQGSQNRMKFELRSNSSLEQSFDTDEEQITKSILEANILTLEKSAPTSNPSTDAVSFISSLVISLATLRRLPEAIEHLRQNMSPAITNIINTASQQVAEVSASFEDDLQQLQQPQLLLDVLELTFAQLRIVSQAHKIVIANLIRLRISSNQLNDFKLYSISDFWSRTQRIIQSFLANYLEVDDSADSMNQSDELNADFNSFFIKKRPLLRNKRTGMLFKFNQSDQTGGGGHEKSNNLSMNHTLVCKPSVDNITTIYNALRDFLNEISNSTKQNTNSLSLYVYISSFIEGIFFLKLQRSMEAILNQVPKSHDVKKTLTDAHTQKSFKLSRPLFQSTISIATYIEQVCQLTSHMSDYSPKLMNIMCKCLQDYLTSLQTHYGQLTQQEDRRIISAAWVKDNDINRFLKSLPNWLELKRCSDVNISEVDMRGMNAKESQVISNNLSGSELSSADIITDHMILRHLSYLCESSLWFSDRINQFCNNLQNGNTKFLLSVKLEMDNHNRNCNMSSHKMNVSPDTLMTLKSLAKHFEDLSDSCLLLLHLEVRMHCLFHLLRLPENDYFCLIDRLEPDEHVTRLSKDLTQIEASLVHSLQENRFKYVVQGLGHLMATTLISGAACLKRINDTGVKKMCRNVATIQQCLTVFMDVREPDLDHAKQFYEMLYLSPDEVMKACFNTGNQFTEQEYVMLMQLNHRSNPEVSTEHDLNRRLKKLASLLGDSSA